MEDIKFSDIIKLNQEFRFDSSQRLEICVLSNISVQQSKEILEYSLRREGVNAHVTYGDYNNIVQGSEKYAESRVVIVFWEICNLVEGLELKNYAMSDSEIKTIIESTKLEIDIVLENFSMTPLVLFNRFSSILFTYQNHFGLNLKKIVYELNNYMDGKNASNIKIIDIGDVIAWVGTNESFNKRYYYSTKTLYTVNFFKSYVHYIKPYILGYMGKSKKAIIFDCDNTLWSGIVGEDGLEGIDMSPVSHTGRIFNQIQNIALALNKRGIIIGLCSKNNPEDVENVIQTHPDLLIKEESISIKKINWNDKVNNLKEIATELNIGLDAIVFIDDSEFEVHLVQEQLPEVKVIKVPEKLVEYPFLFLENMNLFFNLSFTNEDLIKTKQYKEQSKRENAKYLFQNIEDYLRSLELSINIIKNDSKLIVRLSQLTQKTNQFNLMTKRYTEAEIMNFVNDENYDIFGVEVQDKYGDYGLTALCIVKKDNKNNSLLIDSFLLSCRIIGRNIEFALIDYLINLYKKCSYENINACYKATKKNDQVKHFFDNCSFEVVSFNEEMKYYRLNINNYLPQNIDYIKIKHG